MEAIWNLVWAFLNSPLGYTAIIAVVGLIAEKIYLKKPLWQQYEGVFISAVKMAEKAVPDDSENTAVDRLNQALRYVVKVLEKRGKKVKKKEIAEIESGIGLIHEELVLKQTLKPAVKE